MNKYIITTLFVLFILLNLFIVHSNNKKKLVLKCYGHALTVRKDSNDKESKLNVLSSFFLYSNGEGILTQIGNLDVNSKKYHIDRAHKIHFSDDDNDGVYTMETHSMMKRAYDT
ncbi:hypothetical protein IM288_22080, partial [Enterobacter cloacae complex sp. P32C]|uniref:hypothetical protein n=1 Tax=Enterobacter cloacae complex sp. P32C TaxID=2779559 RepID=UPI0018681A0B